MIRDKQVQEKTEAKKNDNYIEDFELKYNTDFLNIIPNESKQESTEVLKLPGTINGDERMHKQLYKYLQRDKSQSNYEDKLLNLDPFKQRDSHYMAFKYHKPTEERNMAHLQNSQSQKLYKSFAKNDKNSIDKQFKAYENSTPIKIKEQLDKYNPFVLKSPSSTIKVSRQKSRSNNMIASREKAMKEIKKHSTSVQELNPERKNVRIIDRSNNKSDAKPNETISLLNKSHKTLCKCNKKL